MKTTVQGLKTNTSIIYDLNEVPEYFNIDIPVKDIYSITVSDVPSASIFTAPKSGLYEIAYTFNDGRVGFTTVKEIKKGDSLQVNNISSITLRGEALQPRVGYHKGVGQLVVTDVNREEGSITFEEYSDNYWEGFSAIKAKEDHNATIVKISDWDLNHNEHLNAHKEFTESLAKSVADLLLTIPPKVDKLCSHSWKSYSGILESYSFCEKCYKKKDF